MDKNWQQIGKISRKCT